MPSRKEAKGILENGKIFNLLALCTDHVDESRARITWTDQIGIPLSYFFFLFFFSPFRTTGYIMS